jgi:hypothetical protein
VLLLLHFLRQNFLTLRIKNKTLQKAFLGYQDRRHLQTKASI